MKALFALSMTILLLAGCAKREQSDAQAGATQSAYTDVIGSNRGYIVENAQFAAADDKALFTIGDKFALAAGSSSVLILREQESESRPGYILALQFPTFAPGTSKDYGTDPQAAQFWLLGTADKVSIVAQTGTVSGSVRFIKKAQSTIDLGLNREITDGVGDIEVVAAGISVEKLKFDTSKKFAARFQLPIITIEELAKINQPS